MQKPGRRARAWVAGQQANPQRTQATFLNALPKLSFTGSAVSVATFCAIAASSLRLRGQRLELLARMRGGQLDHLGERLHRHQLGGEIERRVGVLARRLDHLEAVIGGALASRSRRCPRARRSPPRRRTSSSRRSPSPARRSSRRSRGMPPGFPSWGSRSSAARISAFRKPSERQLWTCDLVVVSMASVMVGPFWRAFKSGIARNLRPQPIRA